MLVLNKLTLENFMSISNAELEFKDSNAMLAITGENGAGKSSMFYAVAMVLFSHKQSNTFQNYIKVGTESAHVFLEATLKGEPLTCDLKITKKGTERTTVYDGTTYINSDHDKFLKDNEIDFLGSLMFFFQDSKRDIIDSTPAERAAALKKLFRFDFSSIVSDLKDRLEEEKTSGIENSAILKELTNRTFTTQAMCREMPVAAVNEWRAQLDTVTRSLQEVENVDESDITANDLAIKNNQLQMGNQSGKVEATRRQIALAEVSLCKIKNYLEESGSLEDARANVAKITEEIGTHQVEYQEQKNTYDQLKQRLGVEMHEVEALEKQYAVAQGGVCSSCGQTISQEYIDGMKAKLADAQARRDATQSEIAAMAFDVRDLKGLELQNKLRQAEQLCQQIEGKTKEYQTTEASIDSAKSLLQEQEDMLSRLNETQIRLDQEKSLLEYKRPLLEKREQMLQEQTTLVSQIKQAEETHIRNITIMENNEKVAKDREERDSRLVELNQRAEELNKAMADTKTSIHIFDTLFPNYIVYQCCEQLEQVINSIIQRVFPYLAVKLEMTKAGVTFSYTSESSADDWLPVSMASGAQKMVLALAYKIAIAKLYGVKCMLLDEVDSSLKSENVSIIYQFLASLDDFDQLIFISHRAEAIEAAQETNGNIDVLYVDKGEYRYI